ncbi:hypothetical protein [Nitrospira sp.]
MAGSITIEEWKIFNVRDDHSEPPKKAGLIDSYKDVAMNGQPR